MTDIKNTSVIDFEDISDDQMKQLAEQGSQFIISTHSPIVMSYPGAEIYEITDRGLEPTELEETSHFRLMKRFILDRRGILRQMELEKE